MQRLAVATLALAVLSACSAPAPDAPKAADAPAPAAKEPEHVNPLLTASTLPLQAPPFDRIRVEHVEPAVRVVLARLARDLETLERNAGPSWEAVVPALDEIGDRLGRVWGVVSHLMGVRNSPELRTAHEAVQPDVVAFSLRLGQSRPIYEALRALREGPEWAALDAARQRILDTLIRDAQLSGVGLERKADWIAKFLMKTETIKGEKHEKKFKGPEADLKLVSAWLETLKTKPEKK